MASRLRRVIGLASLLIIAGSLASAQTPKPPDPGLVGALTKQVGVTSQQATGGAGAIFSLVKGRLTAEDFGKIASAVPGMGGFLKAAPKQPADSANPVAAAVGPLTGGGGAASTAGLLSLACSFKSLGLSPQTATRFAPVIQQYLSKKGGGVASLFSKAVGI